VLKHPGVKRVTLVDLDPAMTRLAREHYMLLEVNFGAMNSPKVTVVNGDAAKFLERNTRLYGVVIADLPDPDTIDLMHVYSENFYSMIQKSLVKGGVMVTQASSPFFTREAFQCIMKTVQKAGFSVVPYQNQIPTMGQWGWVLGARSEDISAASLKKVLLNLDFSDLETKFINRDAVVHMTHFGKGVTEETLLRDIEVNTELNPKLYQYYGRGSWGVY
jgi:spermidine synthase